jgi:hypothetical protein
MPSAEKVQRGNLVQEIRNETANSERENAILERENAILERQNTFLEGVATILQKQKFEILAARGKEVLDEEDPNLALLLTLSWLREEDLGDCCVAHFFEPFERE